ncbi:hypothetical protein FISHEDRAFT_71354 [Fistulina hepatica ATCC 64428]|nr:hypothetical protein FISHEDRAFT_71354 [Fistulina hepatica ATCC 64428]
MSRVWKIGGFHPSVRVQVYGYDTNKLAEDMFARLPLDRDGRLRLIVGIESSGCSSLLLTENDMRKLGFLYGNMQSQSIDPFRRYDSLSPIFFSHSNVLAEKFKELTPKKSKYNVDTSRANIAFDSEKGREQGSIRIEYECSRNLYEVIHDEYDSIPRWFIPNRLPGRLRFCAFAFNAWNRDHTRSKEDRISRPKILDIGWCEVDQHLLNNIDDPASEFLENQHFIVAENKALSMGPGLQKLSFNGISRPCSGSSSLEIQRLFDGGVDYPMILLVWDWTRTEPALKYLGVDMSSWCHNGALRTLLYGDPQSSTTSRWHRHDQPSYQRSRDPRRRSRSPRTRPNDDGRADRGRHGGRDPNQSKPPFHPVYVVDVRSLYFCMSREHDESVSRIPIMASKLALCSATSPQWWCAGLEAPLLLKAWLSLAGGNSIDERYRDFLSAEGAQRGVGGSASSATPGASEGQEANDYSDEDDDPNRALDRASRQGPAPVMGGDFDASGDDDDDLEEESESDSD